MWCPNDKQGFLSSQTQGQINEDNALSTWIRDMCRDENNKVFLEIGTWNGLGSTRVFVDALEGRTDTTFYSLECNSEKSAHARKFYEGVANVHILNEILVELTPEQVYEVFPEAKDDPEFNRWNTVDIENMKECAVFSSADRFDVVLLDGGEFTTWHEFQHIKDKCRYLLLDDTNANKCKKIVEEVKAHPEIWKILGEEQSVRNGVMMLQRL
jgi:hypothetical protein